MDKPVLVYLASESLLVEYLHTQQRIHMLAIWLGVSANRLRFGEDSEKPQSNALSARICVAEGW